MSSSGEIIAVPRFALVVLMGPVGALRREFAQKWFPRTAIVSLERCHEMVADEPSGESATVEALALLETWVAARIRLGRLTVVDTPGLDPRFRARMLELAREYHAPALLFALDPDPGSGGDRGRPGGRGGKKSFRGRKFRRFRKALERVGDESWNRVVAMNGRATGVEVTIRPLRVDCDTPPPYDLIGDIHGCYDELVELLERLGYVPDEKAGYRHPRGRRVVFVGDLVDRGPASLEVLKLAMAMHRSGAALVTPGNHDNKLLNHLVGSRVRQDHGLERTVAELERMSPEARARFVEEVTSWLRSLPPYLMLDRGRLVVAHAGLPEHLHGRLSRVVASWALYGAVRPVWEYDRPGRATDWPASYRGKALVVFGHTPTPRVETSGNAICVDQGCVFGGKLTALRYPEREVVQVSARDTYYPDDAPDLEVVTNGTNGADAGDGAGHVTASAGETARDVRACPDHRDGRGEGAVREATGGEGAVPSSSMPGGEGAVAPQGGVPSAGARRETPPDTPDIGALMRGGTLPTGWLGPIKVRAQPVSMALDILGRSGVDPRWLVFVPPPIPPSASSSRRDYVDHLEDVFQYYRPTGLRLVVEEMHFGHRAVVVIGRDDTVCESRFGIRAPGAIYDGQGRCPVPEDVVEETLGRIRDVLERRGAFERLDARLLVLDVTLFPWNLGKQEYVARQCLPAATALLASRARALEALDAAIDRGVALQPLRDAALCDHDAARRTLQLLEQHVGTVTAAEHVRFAPHQVLATEKRTFFEQDRLWQWSEIDRWVEGADMVVSTRRVVVSTREEERRALAMWEEVGTAGKAGLVVRTMDWFPSSRGRPELPAVKVRGREALRLTAGPLYLAPGQIGRIKERPLRSRQNTVIRTWALASEGLERFVHGAPYSEYHPYALAVLSHRTTSSRRGRR